MKPRMSDMEAKLFYCMLQNKRRYIEFGSGGSTFIASQVISETIITVDSSKEWLDKVEIACRDGGHRILPLCLFADIGPTGPWGVPSDKTKMHLWPNYHGEIWNIESSRNADIYFIDGRFRVACFLKSLIHCRPDSIIMIHDFSKRPKYHIVKSFAFEIARCEELSVFTLNQHSDPKEISKTLEYYNLIYD